MSYEEQARKRIAFLKQARNLARSGEHPNWEGVAAALESPNGARDARLYLEDNWSMRAQLNQLCLAARKGETVPRGPRGARPPHPIRID